MSDAGAPVARDPEHAPEHLRRMHDPPAKSVVVNNPTVGVARRDPLRRQGRRLRRCPPRAQHLPRLNPLYLDGGGPVRAVYETCHVSENAWRQRSAALPHEPTKLAWANAGKRCYRGQATNMDDTFSRFEACDGRAPSDAPIDRVNQHARTHAHAHKHVHAPRHIRPLAMAPAASRRAAAPRPRRPRHNLGARGRCPARA